MTLAVNFVGDACVPAVRWVGSFRVDRTVTLDVLSCKSSPNNATEIALATETKDSLMAPKLSIKKSPTFAICVFKLDPKSSTHAAFAGVANASEKTNKQLTMTAIVVRFACPLVCLIDVFLAPGPTPTCRTEKYIVLKNVF